MLNNRPFSLYLGLLGDQMKNLKVTLVLTMNFAVLILLCLSMLYPIQTNENQPNTITQNPLSEREITSRLPSITRQLSVENIGDEEFAENSSYYLPFFSVYASSFDRNWTLVAEQSQTMDFIDENDTYWFTFTIASKTDQTFNLSFLTAEDSPNLDSSMNFGVELSCEKPQDILFLTLLYSLPDPLINDNQSFPVYTWVSWDQEGENWGIPKANYNQVSHAWETTVHSFSPYFALIETDSTTRLKSVEVGGGSIPSFELPVIIVALWVVYGLKIRKNQKNGE
jgi:hypothetical protein